MNNKNAELNNKNAEWQREYYLTHDKYRMQGQGTNCYKVIKDLTRILQLPTIAKLTTDNESVIGDFRLNRGEYGLEPYDEYAIKVYTGAASKNNEGFVRTAYNLNYRLKNVP